MILEEATFADIMAYRHIIAEILMTGGLSPEVEKIYTELYLGSIPKEITKRLLALGEEVMGREFLRVDKNENDIIM